MAIYLGTNEVSLAGPPDGYLLNGRLIATKTYSFNLGQTNYSSVEKTTTQVNLTLFTTEYTTTAGTTVTCFRLGENYDGTIIDRNAHDYIVFCNSVINYNYGSNNVSSTIHGIRSAFARDFQGGKYINNVNASTGQLGTSYTKNNSYITSCYPLLYQKADNTYGITTTSCGIWHNNSGPATFATTNSKDYLDLKCGAFAVKANDSYCPVAALQAINPANTTVQVTWYVYEGDRTMYTNIYETAYRLAANP